MEENNKDFEFNPDKPLVDLSFLINKEKLLHLALSTLNSNSTKENCETAESIIIWYVIRTFQCKNKKFNNQDIQRECDNLVFGALFDNLAKKGMIEELIPDDGQTETQYKVYDEGVKALISDWKKNKGNKNE